MKKSLCWAGILPWLAAAPAWAGVGDLKPISIAPRKMAAAGFEPEPIHTRDVVGAPEGCGTAHPRARVATSKVTIKEAAFTIQSSWSKGRQAPAARGSRGRAGPGGTERGQAAGQLGSADMLPRELSSAACVVGLVMGLAEGAGPAASAPADTSALALLPRQGLVSYWPGDGYARDVVGGNHGRLADGASWRAGVAGQAFCFDGRAGHVPLSSTKLLGAGDRRALTIAAWVRQEKPGWAIILMQGGSCPNEARTFKGNSMRLLLTADGHLAAHASGGRGNYTDPSNVIQSAAPVPTGRWVHVALVFDEGAMRLYINARRDEAKAVFYDKAGSRKRPVGTSRFKAFAPSTDQIRIGCGYSHERGHVGACRHFPGLIDEVAVWRRALSDEEVRRVALAPYLREVAAGDEGSAPPQRTAESDRLVKTDGSALAGTLLDEAWELDTRFGRVRVASSQLTGLARAKPDGTMRLFLVDGQVLIGSPRRQAVRMRLADASTVRIPVAKLRECGWRITRDRPPWWPAAGPKMVVLRGGERLTWTALTGLRMKTRFGTVSFRGAGVADIWRPGNGSPPAVTFANGTVLGGTLLPGKLTVKLALGPRAAMAADQLRRVFGDGDASARDGQATLHVRGGGHLVGELTAARLVLQTEDGQHELLPPCTYSLDFGAGAGGKAVAKLWNETIVTGRLAERTLGFRIGPDGPTLEVPVGQIASIARSAALPPPAAIRRIEKLVAQLGATRYVDRERAAAELKALGPSIAPVLRRHSKHPDLEVRIRIERLLKELTRRGVGRT